MVGMGGRRWSLRGDWNNVGGGTKLGGDVDPVEAFRTTLVRWLKRFNDPTVDVCFSGHRRDFIVTTKRCHHDAISFPQVRAADGMHDAIGARVTLASAQGPTRGRGDKQQKRTLRKHLDEEEEARKSHEEKQAEKSCGIAKHIASSKS